jgi:hypothetical protein
MFEIDSQFQPSTYRNKNSWHFRTIGMGTINYRKAALRLAAEAASTGLFTSSLGMSERFLKEKSPSFWQKHHRILRPQVPGFGWWIWKPEFIKVCLEMIPEHHGLLYLDAGSWISQQPQDLATVSTFFELATTETLLGSNSQNFIEEEYCSTEMMDLLGLDDGKRKSNQFWAGFLIIINNKKGRDFVASWSELLCKDEHKYLLHRGSAETPDLVLRHHMYDQAVFSCLMKKNNVTSVPTGDRSNEGVIRAIRHRYAYTIHETNRLKIAYYNCLHFLSRIRLYFLRRFNRNHLLIESHKYN